MDIDKQLYDIDATGWKRGLYDDIKRTFRAPFINWIFRTNMANHPELFRTLWFRVKPVFTTGAFARFTVRFRNEVLSKCEENGELPTYRRDDLGLCPSEYRELQEQLATFDIVAPRLAVLFEVLDRMLHDEPVGDRSEDRAAVTEPYPDWLDENRGKRPTMIGVQEVPAELERTLAPIHEFHGYDESLPSIYRCAAQWPEYLEAVWDDLAFVLEEEAFGELHEDTYALTREHARRIPYQPQITLDCLERAGFDEGKVSGMKELFRVFNRGRIAAHTVIPLLLVFAATVGAEGLRESAIWE
jgi:hypothetical protein